MGIRQRIERVEAEFGLKNERRVIIITMDPDGISEEGPYSVELFAELWAYIIRGRPFTDEEIRQLRKEEKTKWEKWKKRIDEHNSATL